MDEEAKEIREGIELIEKRRKTTRIPLVIRQKSVEYIIQKRRMGMSWEKIGKAVGLSPTTLQRWYNMSEKNPQHGKLVPVEVKSEAVYESRHYVLISPSGYRLESLDIKEAAILMRELR